MNKLFTIVILMLALLIGGVQVYGAPLQAPSGIPFSEMESRIDELVESQLGISTPGIAVVVIHEGEIIFSKGYGYAHIERGLPIDPASTLFGYGSIGKTMTWVSVMQLVEQGLLDLDADIRTYLPQDLVSQLTFEHPFTMRDILNHSAGFQENILGMAFELNTVESQISVRDGLIMNEPNQIFRPGTVSTYSNWGTTLAGYVVSYITGQSFAAYEMENILIPAGMVNTLNQPDWFNNHYFLHNKAVGYIPDGRGGFNEAPLLYFPGYAAGAIIGTAEDLARFAIALTPPDGEPGVLFQNAGTLPTIFSPSTLDPNMPTRYHGFLRYLGTTYPGFGHGGDLAAFSTNFAVVPQERFGVIVLTNAGGELDLRFSIIDLLLGNNIDQIQPSAENLPHVSAVEGRFITARGHAGSFLEFFDYLQLQAVVRAVDESTISFSMSIPLSGMTFTGTFVQVEPYVFHMTEADGHLLPLFTAGEIRFVMEEGVPVQIQLGNPFDFVVSRSMFSQIVSAVIAIANILFFLIAPIALLVISLKNRNKDIAPSRFRMFSNSLLISNALLMLNNLALMIRVLVANMLITAAEIAPHIWINYIFAGLTLLIFVGSLLYLFKEKEAIRIKRKIFYYATASLAVLFICILHSWNFFVTL